MVKAVVFDMDGVLIDAREWHYLALNEALSYFGSEISVEEHHDRFDGLPTRVKLNMLSTEHRLPLHMHGLVEEIKQDRTLRLASAHLYPVVAHQIMLGWLKENNLKIGVATNSIRATSEHMLNLARVSEFLDVLITNQDVIKAKPNPEMYLLAAQRLGFDPHEVLVVEDSPYGVEAATAAGCKVVQVSDPSQVGLALLRPILEVNDDK